MRIGLTILAFLLPIVAYADDKLPEMKFNEVKEVAPGIFFRYSSISATDKNIVFGGSNNIWIVFEDYVLVYDANFPKEAGDVIEAIKKTTDKPIRYVLDSHHHGDHAYGNAVFAKAGATIIGQANCARWLREKGPKEFADAGRGPTGRKDIAESSLKVPNIVFDDKLVLDDGKQRAELLFLGHAHTPGDALLYLPKHRILCTGDACVNGAFNYTGHSDTASWIRVMERAQQLEVKMVCPGHGRLATKELLDNQKRYFIELRQQVQKGIEENKNLDDIAKSINIPWYKEWTGVEASSREENIKHVFAELTGRIMPWDLFEEFGIVEGPSPTKDTPGWTKPKRIVVPNLMPARLAEFKRIAPEVEFVPCKTAEDAAKAAVDADAVIGFCTPEIVKSGKNLRWIQTGAAGVEKDLFPELIKSPIVMTNTQRIYGPQVADQAFALLLSLTRGVSQSAHARQWKPPEGPFPELRGKTMLLIGLGGVGTEIARRGQGFGMRVRAIDPKEMERPSFVFSLDKPDRLMDLLSEADVVVLACPLTDQTRRMMSAKQFKAMKPTAYFINIARGGLVNTASLKLALEQKWIAGAGLDVTDPEPLPPEDSLWKTPNLVITPHLGGQSDQRVERQFRLWRENVRRFVAGEPLICVVDKEKGY